MAANHTATEPVADQSPSRWQIIATYPSSRRFDVHKVVYNGNLCILKKVKSELKGDDRQEAERRLAQEVWYFCSINSIVSDSRLRCPYVLTYSHEWSLNQLVEGSSGSVFHGYYKRGGDVRQYLSDVAWSLAVLDQLVDDPRQPKPFFSGKKGRTLVNDWGKKSENMSQKVGLLSSKLIDLATEKIELYQQEVTTCLQHNDYLSHHLIFNAAGDIVIIDGEASSVDSARFRDVAVFHARAYMDFGPDNARHFVDEFVRIGDVTRDEFWPMYLPVLINVAADAVGNAVASKSNNDSCRRALEFFENSLKINPQ